MSFRNSALPSFRIVRSVAEFQQDASVDAGIRWPQSRISGTPSARIPLQGEATEQVRVCSICSRVTSPSRRAPSRVDGKRSREPNSGIPCSADDEGIRDCHFRYNPRRSGTCFHEGGFSLAFRKSVLGLIGVIGVSLQALAQRLPVLNQIDEPHAYYFREMYLPQLTTGPSSLAWSPDSKSLVYSMAGSLWLQRIDSQQAEELTAGPGYDYQPDWSADGRWIVYSKYDKSAIELWALDVESRKAHVLTSNQAVNVEPRFSPDGKRIAFVSTTFNGRFHIFVGRFEAGGLQNIQRLTGENRSSLPRYYYSVFDHEISPTWSRDGAELLFVSNRGHLYGTGGFWRMKAEPGAEPREIHYEETTWKARPDFSPDGKRIVYASYLGQAWHQLWVLPAEGGDAFPLSYGQFDNINPRWSPDGGTIAFISNRDGNTSLFLQQVLGADQKEFVITSRRFLHPMGQLELTVLDENAHETAARVSIVGEDGRAYAPNDAWMHADDGFDRREFAFEAHYFHGKGRVRIDVPAGRISIGVMKGFEHRFASEAVDAREGQTTPVTVHLQGIEIPGSKDSHWVSGDVHVHMNYGGAYRNTPAHLVFQAEAEDLPITENLVVNKEQRIPDITYFRTSPDLASTPTNLLLHGQEFHTSYWGHLGLLHLTRNFLIPDYAAYANTAAASLFPTNASIADLAHEQQGVVGYVHPFDTYPDPEKEKLSDELPVDVALGKVDYIEAMGFSDHKSTARVWYRLLNCGFRLPTAAGTDAMANFASLRGPVGLNRVYVEVPMGPLEIEPWLANLKRGRTFATNGPLLGFSLGGEAPGGEVKLSRPAEIKFAAWLRSIVPVDHLEVICNGKVIRELKLTGNRDTATEEGTLPIADSGWCLLRAASDNARYPVLDLYPYATTSPIYVTVSGSKPRPAEDVAYFEAWIDQLVAAAEANPDWNSKAEKQTVLDQLSRARKIYEQLLQ
jgi:TolB protein